MIEPGGAGDQGICSRPWPKPLPCSVRGAPSPTGTSTLRARGARGQVRDDLRHNLWVASFLASHGITARAVWRKSAGGGKRRRREFYSIEYRLEGRKYDPGHLSGWGIPVPRSAFEHIAMDLQ